MITFDNLSVRYGSQTILRDISADLVEPMVTIMGPSGSGKSSLLRVVAGTQRPSAGSVAIDGAVVSSYDRAPEPSGRVALIHQDYRLVEFLTVKENIALAAELRGVELNASRVGDALALVGLETTLATRLPRSLSGGQQQRVAIARAVCCDATLLLADEPTGALDRETSDVIVSLFRDLADRRVAQVVVATHDQRVAERSDLVLELDGSSLEPKALR